MTDSQREASSGSIASFAARITARNSPLLPGDRLAASIKSPSSLNVPPFYKPG